MEDVTYDVCIIGSGAGGAPIAYELSKKGFNVVVLEKGPWIKTEDFTKDEILACRKDSYTPNLKDEKHSVETKYNNQWRRKSTENSGWNFWNGNMVGGSSNLMSGYFHRMKPSDFKLRSTYGDIDGGNIVDWPIGYNDLEPYYDKVEKIVGVSGQVRTHRFLEPRSSQHFPYPPLNENIVSSLIDKTAQKSKIEVFPTPRAILSQPKDGRQSCFYSNFCGSYGCSSDAKSSARASLLNQAIKTGRCEIIPNAKVFHLEENDFKIQFAHYYKDNAKHKIRANTFVVSAQAIESCRLLLMSKSQNFQNGLGNNHNLVGKNIVFSAGGTGSGIFDLQKMPTKMAQQIKTPGLWINRACQHWYEITQQNKTIKGGTVDFLFEHANAIVKAIRQKYTSNGKLLFGNALQDKIEHYFKYQQKLKFEVFVDWTPNDDCFVSLDPNMTDKWGDPVAKIRLNQLEHDTKVGKMIAQKMENFLQKMGLENVQSSTSIAPPTNLQAGGCRFGNDQKTSVLNTNCQVHDIANLYVSDGSFMPTGGSTTFTFTIYANAFRIADQIKSWIQPI